MTPVSALSVTGQIMGRAFPMTYFMPITVGTFTKGLGFGDLAAISWARHLHSDPDADQPAAVAQARALGDRPMRSLGNIFWLGTKELRSFMRDFVLLGLVIYSFSLAIIAQSQSNSQELHNASIAYVDEDNSVLSRRIVHAFLPPYFQTPQPVTEREIVPLMNAGKYTFVMDIPPNFERDMLGGRQPTLQIDVDATAMVQAGLGSDYMEQIITHRDRGLPLACRRHCLGAGQSRHSYRVQSQCHDGLVHQRDGHHQQRHHARHHPCGRGHRARTRARHHGPSLSHAGDAV